MALLFSRSFHCLWLPCCNVPPKSSERLRIYAPIPLPKPWVSFTHHTRLLPNATSSPNSDPEDFDILSSTEHSDGSFVFRFASANEIREQLDELNKKKKSDALNKKKKKLAREGVLEEGKAGVRALVSESVKKLNTEVDRTLGGEIESSSTVVVDVADQNPQLLLNEKEGDVLDSDSGPPVTNDLQKIDRHLKLDSVEDGDGQRGISSEDVGTESNGVPSASEADSELDSHREAVVSTVATEADVVSDLKSDAFAEVEEEEEAGKSYGVDRTTNNLAAAVDAELSELVPESTFLDSEQVGDSASNNQTDAVNAESSELVPESTCLESEQVGYSETNNLTDGVDANLSDLMPVSTSLESEQVGYGATNNLIAAVDANISELLPESTSAESEQVGYSETNNMTSGVDADLSELTPVSSSLESELVANDEETAHLIVDDFINASKMGKSELSLDEVPSSNLENNIDVDNTERSDYESTSQLTVPQILSAEVASHGEKTSKTELFLISGAACLPHPSKVERMLISFLTKTG